MRSKLSIWDCSCGYCLDFVWLSHKERNCYSTLIYIPHLLCIIYLPCYVLHDNPQRPNTINSLYWYLYIQQTLVSSSQMFSVNPSPPLSHQPVMNCLSKITCFPAVWASRMFQHLVVISGGWALTDVCPLNPKSWRGPSTSTVNIPVSPWSKQTAAGWRRQDDHTTNLCLLVKNKRPSHKILTAAGKLTVIPGVGCSQPLSDAVVH